MRRRRARCRRARLVRNAPHRGAVRMTVTASGQRSWVLDRGAGWHALVRQNVVADERGGLTLSPLPGRGERIEWPDPGREIQPAALAGNPSAGLYLLDGNAH